MNIQKPVVKHHFLPDFHQRNYKKELYSLKTDRLYQKKFWRKTDTSEAYCLNNLFKVFLPNLSSDCIEKQVWGLDHKFSQIHSKISGAVTETGKLSMIDSEVIFNYILSLDFRCGWFQHRHLRSQKNANDNYNEICSFFNVPDKSKKYLNAFSRTKNHIANAWTGSFSSLTKKHHLSWSNYFYHIKTESDLILGEEILVSVDKAGILQSTDYTGLKCDIIFLPISARDLIVCSKYPLTNLEYFKQDKFCRSLNWTICLNSKLNISGSEESLYPFLFYLKEIKPTKENGYKTIKVNSKYKYWGRKQSNVHKSIFKKIRQIQYSNYLLSPKKYLNLLESKTQIIQESLNYFIENKVHWWIQNLFFPYIPSNLHYVANQLIILASHHQINKESLQEIIKRPLSTQSLKILISKFPDYHLTYTYNNSPILLKNNTQELSLNFLRTKKAYINGKRRKGIVCKINTKKSNLIHPSIKYLFLFDLDNDLAMYSIYPKERHRKDFSSFIEFPKIFNGKLIKELTGSFYAR